jgi:hypothetical protein
LQEFLSIKFLDAILLLHAVTQNYAPDFITAVAYWIGAPEM